MSFDTILLDADGTLFDFDLAELRAFESTCTLHGIPGGAQTYSTYHEINEGLWKLLERGGITQPQLRVARFERLFETLGMQGDPHAFNLDYAAALGRGTYLIGGALELCRTLSESRPLYIVTNGLLDVQTSRLADSLLAPYISRMFISEEIGCSKPRPEFFDAVFEQLGNPCRERAILLGDSLTSDMQGARNAGIASCLFAPDSAPQNHPLCDYQISALSEFLPIALE